VLLHVAAARGLQPRGGALAAACCGLLWLMPLLQRLQIASQLASDVRRVVVLQC